MKIILLFFLISTVSNAQTFCRAQFSNFRLQHQCILKDGRCSSIISDITGMIRNVKFEQLNNEDNIAIKIEHGSNPVFTSELVLMIEEKRTLALSDQTQVDVLCFRKDSKFDIEEQVNSLFSQLSDFSSYNDKFGLCSARSDIWANEVLKKTNETSKKIVILYTDNFKVKNWRYHTAPLITLGEEKWVLEKSMYINEPLHIRDWMLKINNGVPCKAITEVDEYIKNSFIKLGRNNWYNPSDSPEDCYIFETDNSFSSPESGFLGFLPPSPIKPPLDKERLLNSCKTIKASELSKKPSRKQILEHTAQCKSKLGL